ncbi:tetrathionate reductase subunit A [Providencia alcalifaciens]|nr:tetrathionate reductase subunit A [Providencia alcalifaciens]
MAKFSRRQWLKGGLVVGGLALFGASYREVAKRAVGWFSGWHFWESDAESH